VHDGDTVHLPILPAELNEFTSGYPDSTFGFVVDSVRMVHYDTATLKTVYTQRLGNCTANYVYTYGNLNTVGAYAERIGGVSIGQYPQYVCGANIADMSYQTQAGLRCYNDPTLSIKLVADSCGLPPSTAVPIVKKHNIVSLYPNPARTELTVLSAGLPVNSLVITNLLGQTVYSNDPNAKELHTNVESLQTGIYFVKVNGSEVTKLVKQ
jgi:hypothetical protein